MTTITLSTTLTSRPVIGNGGGGGGAIPPFNTVLPIITGTGVVGQTLSCSTGTWAGTLPITYTYQWVRGMSDIPSATSSTYILVQADTGEVVTCQVTATNTAGSASVTSSNSILMLLLDGYPNAATAYSVRKLRTAYTGNCIRVRRSSDNAEQNIGFVNNELDTTSLLSFVGAGNGFVAIWYDQSGNGNDVFELTASWQPRIVNAGVLDIQNSKPTLRFSGFQNRLYRTGVTNFTSNNYRLIFVANKWNTVPTTVGRVLFSANTSAGALKFSINSSTNLYRLSAQRLDGETATQLLSTSTFNNTNMYLTTGVMDYTNSDAFLYFNSNLEDSNLSAFTSGITSNTNSTIYIGGVSSAGSISATNISEIITYTTPQNIPNINTNIQTFFGI